MPRPSILTSALLCCAAGCTIGEQPIDAGPILSSDAGPERGVVIVGQLTAPGFELPVTDATICVRGRPEIECARTTDLGRYRLRGLPEGEGLVLTMEHPRHRDIARLVSTLDGAPPFIFRDPMVYEDAWRRIRDEHAGGLPDPHVLIVRAYEPELGPGYPSRGMTARMEGATGPIYIGPDFTIDPGAEATEHEGGAAFFFSASGLDGVMEVQCDGVPARVDPWSGHPGDRPGEARVLPIDDHDELVAEVACRTGPRCTYQTTPRRHADTFLLRVCNRSDETIAIYWVSPECERYRRPELTLEAGAEGDLGAVYGAAYQVVGPDGETRTDFFATNASVPDGDAAKYVYPPR